MDDSRGTQLEVEVLDDTQRLTRGQLEWLTARTHEACRRMGCGGSLRVRLIDDAAMIAAHGEYLDDPTTTDVLTFDMSEGIASLGDVEGDSRQELPMEPPGTEAVREGFSSIWIGLDTDILACVDVAARQASIRGYSVEKELLLYIVHGVLHCLGHDDHDEAAAARMHATEDAVLTAIGVGAVYGGREVNDSGADGRA
jgi:rRNA maturation RNase YbeY